MKIIPLILLSLILLSGCAHNFSQGKNGLDIIDGKTTKADILKLLGKPYITYKTPGMRIVSGDKVHILHGPSEVWTYVNFIPNFPDITQHKSLRIVFNENGYVLKHAVSGETLAKEHSLN